jgi:hypothetical protein
MTDREAFLNQPFRWFHAAGAMFAVDLSLSENPLPTTAGPSGARSRRTARMPTLSLIIGFVLLAAMVALLGARGPERGS